jgi:serine/threonine protein kinase/tetratricopeptide (TPR) repeat protein
MSEPHIPTELLADVCAAQRRRWLEGDCVPAATLLHQHPRLADAVDCAVELVYNEILLREERGEVPAVEEYVGQFPQWASQLRQLFEVHGALAETSVLAEPGRPVPDATAWPEVPGYELLAELGRGGMGVVYQARHLRLQRLAALKVILAGAHAGEKELARFKTEAEAAARLQHPNIVQIYDVGEYEGRPYLALEYVAGGSLARRLAGGPLPVREAAALVQALAGAMHHAHEHGIVHRDLKPANILLQKNSPQRHKEHKENTEQTSSSPSVPSLCSLCLCGEFIVPKITDFGLAKQLDSDGAQTQSGAILGTPSYMAPEQALSQKGVGPAADIHALGAILYECLTGRPPFLAANPLETLLQVKLLTPVSPRRLQPKVGHDLETICLKCLEKEPAKRYPTAQALADDLGCFLSGRPIQARPVGPFERLWRACRREPRVALLAAAFLVTVGLAFANVTYLWRVADATAKREEAQRQLAVENFQRAEQNFELAEENFQEAYAAVREYLFEFSQIQLNRVPGAQELQKKLLERALASFQRFQQQRPDDRNVQADVAEALFRVGSFNSRIRSRERARKQYEEARALFEDLVQAKPGDVPLRRSLARTCRCLGGVQQETERRADAKGSYGRARDLGLELVRTNPGDAEAAYELGLTYLQLGILQKDGGESGAALDAYKEAHRIFTKLKGDHPTVNEYASRLASVHEATAILHSEARQFDTAEDSFQKFLKIRKDLVEANPRDMFLQHSHAVGLMNHGAWFIDLGKFENARAPLQEAQKIYEKLAGDNPAELLFQKNLAKIHLDLGGVHRQSSDPDAALKAWEQACNIFEKLFRDNPTVTEHRKSLATTLGLINVACREGGSSEEKRRLAKRARQLLEELERQGPGGGK